MSHTSGEIAPGQGSSGSDLALLRQLVDLLPDRIFIKDAEGRFRVSNSAQARALGATTVEDTLGKTDFDYLAEAEAERNREEEEALMASGQPVNRQETRVDPGNGKTCVLQTTKLPLRDGGGKIVGVAGMIRDVTGCDRELCTTIDTLKQENMALANSRIFLEAMLDNIPDWIYFKDTQSRILKLNRSLARDMGMADPEEAVGKTDFDFRLPEQAREFYADEQRMLQSGEALINKTEKQILASGETGWTSTTKAPMRDRQGKIVGLVGINRDITKQKQADEALAEANRALQHQIQELDRIQEISNYNHRLLRSLIDTLPDLFFIKDAESRFLLVNQACATQLGMARPEDVIGKSDADFVKPELAQRYRADEVVLMQSGKTVHQEEPTLHQDSGKMGYSLTTKLPLKDGDGKVIGLMGIARDITALKDAERELEAVNKDLRSASRTAGMAEVAIGVLHNVGNVLNSVNVSAGLVCERLRNSKLASLAKLAALLRSREQDMARFLAEDERGRQIVPYLEQLTRHLEQEHTTLGNEVNGLVSKIEHIKEIVAAQQSYARVCGVSENVSLAELAEDALKIHGAAYERHGVSVVREFNSVPVLTLDKHKVLQILVNLLHNAKYACDATNRPEKQVAIRIKAVGENRIWIQVADNGIGILPEHMKRVFTQGFTTRKGGHGFGLHSGALAARDLGGSLTVHSDGLEKGATFTLELPMTLPKGAA